MEFFIDISIFTNTLNVHLGRDECNSQSCQIMDQVWIYKWINQEFLNILTLIRVRVSNDEHFSAISIVNITLYCTHHTYSVHMCGKLANVFQFVFSLAMKCSLAGVSTITRVQCIQLKPNVLMEKLFSFVGNSKTNKHSFTLLSRWFPIRFFLLQNLLIERSEFGWNGFGECIFFYANATWEFVHLCNSN